MVDGDVDPVGLAGNSGRGLHGEVLEPGDRASRRPHAFQRHDVPVAQPEDRLDRQCRTDERTGLADPPPATEVLEGVDVEHDGRPGTRGPDRLGDGIGRRTTGGEPPPGEHGVPHGHAHRARVDDGDRHRGLRGRQLCSRDRARHVAGDVHRHHGIRTGRSSRLVGLEERSGGGPRRRDGGEGPQRRRDLPRVDVDALGVLAATDDDVQRDDADVEPVEEVCREVGRGVGDEGGAHPSRLVVAVPAVRGRVDRAVRRSAARPAWPRAPRASRRNGSPPRRAPRRQRRGRPAPSHRRRPGPRAPTRPTAAAAARRCRRGGCAGRRCRPSPSAPPCGRIPG